MLQRTLILSASVFLMGGAAAIASPNTDSRAAPSGLYDIEGTHTSVCFTTMHMGLSSYPGCFTKISGAMGFDPQSPQNSKLDIEIDLASVTTASPELNAKLRTDMFKVATNKSATFRSSSAKLTGKNTGTIKGELMIGGVTKPATLNVTFNGGIMHPFANAYALGFDATATIKMSDYGLDKVSWSAFVSDEVKLTIAAEFVAQK